jgi:hypothetical protein
MLLMHMQPLEKSLRFAYNSTRIRLHASCHHGIIYMWPKKDIKYRGEMNIYKIISKA